MNLLTFVRDILMAIWIYCHLWILKIQTWVAEIIYAYHSKNLGRPNIRTNIRMLDTNKILPSISIWSYFSFDWMIELQWIVSFSWTKKVKNGFFFWVTDVQMFGMKISFYFFAEIIIWCSISFLPQMIAHSHHSFNCKSVWVCLCLCEREIRMCVCVWWNMMTPFFSIWSWSFRNEFQQQIDSVVKKIVFAYISVWIRS